MRGVIGQAAGRVGRHLHWLMRVALLLGVMVAAGFINTYQCRQRKDVGQNIFQGLAME